MAINLFGYTITRGEDVSKLARTQSFVPPTTDDGTATVQGGGYFGTYLEMDATAKSEAELITRYREASMYADCSTAVDEILTEAIAAVDDESAVQINLDQLEIPDDIKDSNSVKWGGSSMGVFEAAGAAAGAGLLGVKSLDDLKNKLLSTGQKLGDAAKSGTTQQAIQAGLIGLGVNVLTGKNTATFPRFAGAVFNSNIELLFDGIDLRQAFSFSYDIVPRSEKEATEVKKIIRKFKIHGAAKKGRVAEGAAGLFLKAPEVFRIEYMSGRRPHPYLNRFKICALHNITVNYTGSGTYATYSDATPVHMTMTLTFQELTPIYAEDYETGTGIEGTGF